MSGVNFVRRFLCVVTKHETGEVGSNARALPTKIVVYMCGVALRCALLFLFVALLLFAPFALLGGFIRV